MVALEFVDGSAADPRTPAPAVTKRVIAEALQRHLMLISAGSWGQVVRLAPPLVTTSAEVEEALTILDESMTAARA